MAIVIVTEKHYLLAEKILDITLSENKQTVENRRNGKSNTYTFIQHTITIRYNPEGTLSNPNNNYNNSCMDCYVNFYSKAEARLVFRQIVDQIREQSPDQLFLHKAFEELLKTPIKLETNYKKNTDFDLEDVFLGGSLDSSPKRTSKPRKAKRRTKKVPRKTK